MITKKYLTFYQSIFESLIESLRFIKMDPIYILDGMEYYTNEVLKYIMMVYGLGMMFGTYIIYAYKMDMNETLLDFLSSLGFGIALFVCSLKWRQFFETFYRLPGFYGLLGMMFGTSFTYAYKMDQNWIVETLLDFLSALGLGFIFGTALFIFGTVLFVYFLKWRSLEDSDDGDDEGREVDYMSDESSDSKEELEKDHDIKGVDQDEGISKMLDSDESSDDEKKKSGDDDDDDKDKTGKKKKKKEESDEETDDKKGKKKKSGSAASSRSATPTKEMEKQERDQKRE